VQSTSGARERTVEKKQAALGSNSIEMEASSAEVGEGYVEEGKKVGEGYVEEGKRRC
jgi:hypothetical protein